MSSTRDMPATSDTLTSSYFGIRGVEYHVYGSQTMKTSCNTSRVELSKLLDDRLAPTGYLAFHSNVANAQRFRIPIGSII